MAEPLPATAGGYRPLTGQVAVVTGATSGIGLVTAVELIRLGADVACVIRQTSVTAELDAAMAKADGCYQRVVANLDEPDEVRTIVPRVMDWFGRIDILVNSAGVADVTPFLDQTLESFDAVINLDLRAPFLLCQAAGRAMVEAGRGGRIVNLSSSTAFRATLAGPGYASAKGGLNALTRAAAGAFGPHGITVNAVVPGLTATRMAQVNYPDDEALNAAVAEGPMRNLLGRVSQAEDVAAAVVFLCTPAARQITGQMVHVSGGAVV
jgi:NAD(P)-dependent dehydrogenase (short-subunit alcohol dehydrogenase family)